MNSKRTEVPKSTKKWEQKRIVAHCTKPPAYKIALDGTDTDPHSVDLLQQSKIEMTLNHNSPFTQALAENSPKRYLDMAFAVLGIILLGACLLFLIVFPVYSSSIDSCPRSMLSSGLHFPRAWLIILPAVTVSLDLTSWSGRALFNEFDLIFSPHWCAVSKWDVQDSGFFTKISLTGLIFGAHFLVFNLLSAIPSLSELNRHFQASMRTCTIPACMA